MDALATRLSAVLPGVLHARMPATNFERKKAKSLRSSNESACIKPRIAPGPRLQISALLSCGENPVCAAFCRPPISLVPLQWLSRPGSNLARLGFSPAKLGLNLARITIDHLLLVKSPIARGFPYLRRCLATTLQVLSAWLQVIQDTTRCIHKLVVKDLSETAKLILVHEASPSMVKKPNNVNCL